jgi:hypothetical protein
MFFFEIKPNKYNKTETKKKSLMAKNSCFLPVLCVTLLFLLILCARRTQNVNFYSSRVLTKNSFSLSNNNIPTMKSKRKTAVFLSWTKCHHCTIFDPEWEKFEKEHEAGGDIFKVAFGAGEPEVDETVNWLSTTPVFEGSFPTILGFPVGGGEAVVYTGPRETQSLKKWFASI